MDVDLKKHQKEIVNYMKTHRGAMAVHSTGTGKTLTSVATALHLLKTKIVTSVVFVSPVSLQYNFMQT